MYVRSRQIRDSEPPAVVRRSGRVCVFQKCYVGESHVSHGPICPSLRRGVTARAARPPVRLCLHRSLEPLTLSLAGLAGECEKSGSLQIACPLVHLSPFRLIL